MLIQAEQGTPARTLKLPSINNKRVDYILHLYCKIFAPADSSGREESVSALLTVS